MDTGTGTQSLGANYKTVKKNNAMNVPFKEFLPKFLKFVEHRNQPAVKVVKENVAGVEIELPEPEDDAELNKKLEQEEETVEEEIWNTSLYTASLQYFTGVPMAIKTFTRQCLVFAARARAARKTFSFVCKEYPHHL